MNPVAGELTICLRREGLRKMRLSMIERSSRRIVAAWIPGMAAQDSAEAAPSAREQTIPANREDKVLTAGRMKPAGPAKQWAEQQLIASHKQNRNCRRQEQDCLKPGSADHGGGQTVINGIRGFIVCRDVHAVVPPFSATSDSLSGV